MLKSSGDVHVSDAGSPSEAVLHQEGLAPTFVARKAATMNVIGSTR
jgi:hypothetical protein